jgi:hypothetical protein
MRTGILLSGLIALAVAMPGGANASLNLVQNGNFAATGGITSNTEFGSDAPAGNFLPSWNSVGANAYNILWFPGTQSTVNANTTFSYTNAEKLYGSTTNPPLNSNFISLDGDPTVTGAVTQSISGLVANSLYQVTFNWGAGQIQSKSGATTEKLEVSLGAQNQYTNTVNNVSGGFSGWYTASFNFVATSAVETLSFLSLGTPTGYPPVALLTNISMTKVPEPAAIGLFGAGLGALLLTRLRRRRAGPPQSSV